MLSPHIHGPRHSRQAPLLWNFSGKNTGEGYHLLLQGIFLTQGLNSQSVGKSPALAGGSSPLVPPEKRPANYGPINIAVVGTAQSGLLLMIQKSSPDPQLHPLFLGKTTPEPSVTKED